MCLSIVKRYENRLVHHNVFYIDIPERELNLTSLKIIVEVDKELIRYVVLYLALILYVVISHVV